MDKRTALVTLVAAFLALLCLMNSGKVHGNPVGVRVIDGERLMNSGNVNWNQFGVGVRVVDRGQLADKLLTREDASTVLRPNLNGKAAGEQLELPFVNGKVAPEQLEFYQGPIFEGRNF